MDIYYTLTRREILRRSVALSIGAALGATAFAPIKHTPLRIGACDWSIGKNSDPAAFAVAKEIGLEGIMVNMGSQKDGMHLRSKEMQRQYLDISHQTGVKISSLAMGELNNVPYKSDPRTEEWVSDAIDVASALRVSVILLAFFNANDLRDDEVGIREVIARLKKVAPKAEQKGIILGIESYLSAEQHLDIIEKVGSPNVKVYYDFRNSADAGYDVIREIKRLGKDNICELHIKENGMLLGEGTLDWKRIGEALVEIGYRGDGWMQIEGATPDGADIVKSYRHNTKFISKAFGYS